MSQPDDLISARDAANLLGVKISTIYTYVTRGHLNAHRLPADRASWFSREEVEQLRLRTGRRAAGTSRDLTSSITLIADGSYWYRGHPALELAHAATFERVAELLWTGVLPDTAIWEVEPLDPVRTGAADAVRAARRPLDALRVAASALAVADELRFTLEASSLVVSARQILVHLVQMLPERSAVEDPSFAALVWSRLHAKPPAPTQLAALNGALVLLADHGIAPSTLAARTAASYRADPYGVVQAGLAIMAGGWHGGRALSAEQMLEDIEAGQPIARVIGERYRQGGIPALGQPRYPNGDPRFRVLLDLVEGAAVDATVVRAMKDMGDLIQLRALPPPSVEFGLAVMSRAFDLVRGASEAIFAVARAAGWLAHGMEEYGRGMAPAPEFRYTGISPVERHRHPSPPPAPRKQ